jgi:hypothetical protein
MEHLTVTIANHDEANAPPLLGLKDGGHIYPRCRDCDRPLCDIWVTDPSVTELRWKARATCAYGCRQKDGTPQTSFVVEFSGQYHQHGISDPDPTDDENYIDRTIVVDMVEGDDGIITFVTEACQ